VQRQDSLAPEQRSLPNWLDILMRGAMVHHHPAHKTVSSHTFIYTPTNMIDQAQVCVCLPEQTILQVIATHHTHLNKDRDRDRDRHQTYRERDTRRHSHSHSHRHRHRHLHTQTHIACTHPCTDAHTPNHPTTHPPNHIHTHAHEHTLTHTQTHTHATHIHIPTGHSSPHCCSRT